ncbi:MAG: hypothetical protein ACOH1L_10525 [Thermomonas sp.]
MNCLSRSIVTTFALLAIALPGLSVTASAQDRQIVGDTLLIERVQEEPANLPSRGMSMAQVEARFGTPSERMDPRGGQKHDWPTINRWMYPGFTVYFERTKVIDVVMNKADQDEIGPKPPTT